MKITEIFWKGKEMGGKAKLWLLMAIFGGLFCFAIGGFVSVAQGAILDDIGVTQGICVVAGDENCEVALELVEGSDLTVYVQLEGDADVEAARAAANAAGTSPRYSSAW